MGRGIAVHLSIDKGGAIGADRREPAPGPAPSSVTPSGRGAVPGSAIRYSAGYGPAVGDGFAHLLGHGLGELRIGLGAE